MDDFSLLQACLISAIIGAVIGGTTNYLAIRMLFRPYQPWRLKGIRIPLTPGIIPGRQAELADNVARMVSNHLIPATELFAAIDTREFRSAIGRTIRNNLEEILRQPFSDIVKEFGGDWNEVAAIACDHLQAGLIDIADTIEIRRALEIMAQRQAGRIADHLSRKLPAKVFSPLRSLFERRFEPTIRQAVAAALHDCLKSPATIATAFEELRPRIEKQAKEARPLEYVPEQALTGVAENAAGRVMNSIRDDVDMILAKIDLRSMVAAKIRSFPSEKMEALAVECARREFIAVTLFGVLLGAVVGVVNPFIYLLLT